MSYLAITKFDTDTTEIQMKIRFEHNCLIKAIRLKVLKHGVLADGNVTLQVLNSDNKDIGSKTLSYEDINQIQGTYAHGFIKFEFDEQVAINKSEGSQYIEVTIKVTMTDHTHDHDNYFALIREENPYFDEFGTRPTTSGDEEDIWFNPYGIEIYGILRN